MIKLSIKNNRTITKTQRLLYLYNNESKISKYDKGWIKQELNRKKNYIRNPPGKHLAHERGREKAKGYGYEYSNLQLISNHILHHKYDNMGRRNKHRPYDIILL